MKTNKNKLKANKSAAYNSINLMKEFMDDLHEAPDPLTGEIHNIEDFIFEDHSKIFPHDLSILDLTKYLRLVYARLTKWSDKVAFITILTCGKFTDSILPFYMPNTGRCLRNYKYVERKLKRHEPIMLNVAYGADGFFFEDGHFESTVDFFNCKEVTYSYVDETGEHTGRY